MITLDVTQILYDNHFSGADFPNSFDKFAFPVNSFVATVSDIEAHLWLNWLFPMPENNPVAENNPPCWRWFGLLLSLFCDISWLQYDCSMDFTPPNFCTTWLTSSKALDSQRELPPLSVIDLDILRRNSGKVNSPIFLLFTLKCFCPKEKKYMKIHRFQL